MATWTDLYRSIQDTRTIDVQLLFSVAATHARGERRKSIAAGRPRSWSDCLADALVFAWSRARTILDNEMAQRDRAKLPATEQWARTAEMEAAICEGSIPPQTEKAAEWRKLAANVRRASFHAVAAE